MHDLWLFVWNVLCHLVALMSGLASFLTSVWEHARGRKLESRVFFIVGLLCLTVASNQAWQDEHRNSSVLIAQKASLTQETDFWKSQNFAKDSNIRDLNKLNLQYLTAATEAQKTANSTQKSLTELTEKVFDSTKPVPGRVITNATRLNTVVADPSKPFTTVIVVGSVTKDYPSFKGSIECESPFELKEGLLSQGMIGLTIYPHPPSAKELPINFGGTTWRAGDTLYALIYGEGLDPTRCHIKSQ